MGVGVVYEIKFGLCKGDSSRTPNSNLVMEMKATQYVKISSEVNVALGVQCCCQSQTMLGLHPKNSRKSEDVYMPTVDLKGTSSVAMSSIVTSRIYNVTISQVLTQSRLPTFVIRLP